MAQNMLLLNQRNKFENVIIEKGKLSVRVGHKARGPAADFHRNQAVEGSQLPIIASFGKFVNSENCACSPKR